MNGAETIRSIKVYPAFLTLAMLALAEPVHAGLLGFEAQTQYDFVQVKRRGSSATGSGRLSTNYNLTLRRPFLPTSTLVSDLSLNSTQSGDPNSIQTSKGWMLNLYSNDPKYMVSGRISHNRYGSSSALLASASGYTTDYNANLFLRQPAYPVLNLQFQRNISGSSYAGSEGGYTTTAWLMSSSYDLKPLRFSVDRIRQTFGYSGSDSIRMNRQTSAVTLNQSLLSGLTLWGELSKTTTGIDYTQSNTDLDVSRRVIRLSATPMRSVVADVALTSLTNSQSVGLMSGKNKDNSLSWSVRSEILPGLSMDYSDQKQSLSGSQYFGVQDSASRNRNLSLAARLTEGTVFSIAKTRTTYDVAAVDYFSRQDSLQSALQTSLTRTTDLSLNYGHTKSNTGTNSLYDSSFQSVSVRDRTSTRLSVGATYRRTKVRSNFAGDSFLQKGNAADLDLLWQPNYDLGINMRLSYQNTKESGAFRAFAPSANVRWQITSSTNVTANYTLQSFQQFDPAHVQVFGQDTRGLAVRLTHNFPNGSNLDVDYGFQGSNIADTEWRRQLRVSYTMIP